MKDNRVEKPSNAGPLLHYCEIAVCDIKVIWEGGQVIVQGAY
jgi:hypothetical protein